MTDTASRGAPVRYIVTPDRVGHALAAGGLAIGATTVLMLVGSGARGAGALASAAMIATFFGVIAIVTVAGPIWLACHWLGRRGPGSAAAAGFGTALLLGGFGQALMPDGADAKAQGWAAAITTIASTLGVGLIGAGVALLMWRIAYRRDAAGGVSRP